MRFAPIPKVTTITRSEWTSIKARRWDYVPKAERMAAMRERLARMRLARQERASTCASPHHLAPGRNAQGTRP